MIQPTLMLVWTQAWQIAVLFFVVLFLFRLFARNRPRVAHLLWGVLLIKCLIPPVVSNSWAPFSWMSHTAQQWLPNDAAESTKITASATHSAQRTNSLRSQPTEEATSIKNANDSTKLNSSWPSHRSIAERWLFVFWIGSIAFVIAVWISRFTHVLHRLHVHRMETPARVTKIVDDLAQWLKLGRQVQIQVTSERIGPAVVGWLRPRVLLPSFLVDRMDDQALRILIAHELTHIRRGDLFWAFLQTVAGSLWWFHPAVWIANRQLNIESERSCDEETIARLKCSPSDYAKCLLQVLEWKHQLVVVPALPGVRPMQVTKDRLERIMKMRHGCYKHNSKGLWLAMVAAVLLVAPGAEYGISQQSTTTPQEPSNAAKQPIELQQGGTVVSDLGVAGQIVVDQPQAVQPPIAQNAIHETRVYEVSDLLERIVADEASNSEEAPKDLERVLTCYETPAIPPAGITTLAASPSPAPPLPRPASLKPDGEFSFLDGKFTATTSEANHQRIETKLARYREFGFKYLHCSVEIFCGPDELSLQGLKWQNRATNSPVSWGFASLDRSQANSVTQFISQQNRIAGLMAPKLMIENTSTGSAMVGTNVSITSSGSSQSVPVPDEDSFEGVRVDVRALIRPEDRIWIEFTFLKSNSRGTISIDTATELHKDEFMAFRLAASERESPRKGVCYFALIHVEPVSMNGVGQLPNAADANKKQNASQDSNTNKVIAIPRFDIE
jgi:beta-lactamase regulating signal transducer with metallopeptidase domain